MNEANTPAIPRDLSDMLPVGMLANGGMAAEAMSALANRKHPAPGWEAFHYERISDQQFEITGGVAAIVGGMKKWPGPHDTVTLNESEIIEEMQRSQARHASPDFSEAARPQVNTSAAPISGSSAAAGTPAKYLHLVLALPDDEAGRQRLLKAFHLQADFFGAKVQACSLQDQA